MFTNCKVSADFYNNYQPFKPHQMEIPIYDNLKDFKENYLIDYSDYSGVISIIKFLKNLKNKYDEKFIDLLKMQDELYYTQKGITESKKLADKIGSNFDSIESLIERLIRQNYEVVMIFGLSTLIDEDNILSQINEKVVEVDLANFSIEIANYINERFSDLLKMREFKLNVIDPFEEIIIFIEREIETEKQNLLRFQGVKTDTPEQPETPELDFSDNTDKVKLIMLEKLGVIDYIKTIQTKPKTISHTSEILSTITGIPSKTLNTYLYPMIRPHRDDDDKNSPYKNPENREKAERELIKLKIKNIDANR